MNKNKVILIVILVFAFITVSFVYYQTGGQGGADKQAYLMRGQIVEVKEDSIIVNGVIGILNQVGGEEEKTIEFKLSTKTAYKLQAHVVTRTIVEGGPDLVASSIEERLGVVSDINTETRIIHILTHDNLFESASATADEIYYFSNVVTTL